MKKEILENLGSILKLPQAEFDRRYRSEALKQSRKSFGKNAFLTGILALGNYCVNDCTYCGLRSDSSVDRFRLGAAQLKEGIDYLYSIGLKRLFLISGEDPSVEIDMLIKTVHYASEKGMFITIGAGVFPLSVLKELFSAGAGELCLKFETANRELFRKIKPSSDFDERIKCIHNAAEVGFKIATGNIIGLEGQSFEDLLVDFKYTLSFSPSWIPLVPYLPAPGTPMAIINPPGDIDLTLRFIALYRLMLEKTLITAGQPRKGSKLGFADPEGTSAAVKSGANIFFVDATPAAVKKDFSIVGGRNLAAYENVMKIIKDNNMLVL